VGNSASFTYPYLMTVDSNGQLYISDEYSCNCVSVFSNTANGTATPLRLIQGDLTQIVDPSAIAVDHSGYLYVADAFGRFPFAPTSQGAQIEIFAPSATGNVAPVQVIVGTTAAPLLPITGLAVDENSNIYVNHDFKIVEYTGTPTSSFVPTKTITPPAAETASSSLRVDTNGNLYVLWLVAGVITPNIGVYSATDTGNATPQLVFSSAMWTATPAAGQFGLW
jgi:hypothetical protein